MADTLLNEIVASEFENLSVHWMYGFDYGDIKGLQTPKESQEDIPCRSIGQDSLRRSYTINRNT